MLCAHGRKVTGLTDRALGFPVFCVLGLVVGRHKLLMITSACHVYASCIGRLFLAWSVWPPFRRREGSRDLGNRSSQVACTRQCALFANSP